MTARLFWIALVFHSLALTVAWPLAWLLRDALNPWFAAPINEFRVYLYAWPVVVILGLATGVGFGIVGPQSQESRVSATRQWFKSIFLQFALVAALGFIVKEFDFGRAVVVIHLGILAVLLPFVGWLFQRYVARLDRLGRLDVPVLIVGANEHGIRAFHRLEDAGHRYRVIGFLDDQSVPNLPQPYLGPLNQLFALAREYKVQEIIIAIPSLDTEQVMSLLLQVESLPVTVHVVSTVFGVLASSEDVEFMGDMPVFKLRAAPAQRPAYDLGKRIMDFLVGLVAFIAMLPLLPLIALAIRLDSPGPVIFAQNRVGRGGKLFKMYKFRTMRTESDPYAVAPKDGRDPRITRVGAFLRKTSLDELPQIFNILGGSMSLVGPRPEMPFIVETYEPWQRRRLDVLPGLTGLWQIVGRKDLPLHENLEYDFYYIRNRSLLFDLVILLRTIPAALFQKGAY